MPTLFLYTSKRAIFRFRANIRGKKFCQMLLTRQDLCSLGEQLFRESTRGVFLSLQRGIIAALSPFASSP